MNQPPYPSSFYAVNDQLTEDLDGTLARLSAITGTGEPQHLASGELGYHVLEILVSIEEAIEIPERSRGH